MTTTDKPVAPIEPIRRSEDVAWHTLSAHDTARQMGVDPNQGLTADEVQRRLEEYGPNKLPTEPPPSLWVVARSQLANPMNIMLLIVGAASLAIAQVGDRHRGVGASDV